MYKKSLKLSVTCCIIFSLAVPWPLLAQQVPMGASEIQAAQGTAAAPAALSPALKAPPAETDPFKEKITLDYKDADIINILRSLSYTYGLNLVTSSDVKGKVTISLKDVTLSEAFEAILSSNGYNYSRKGSIIYITPGTVEGAQLVSEPIILNYIKAADAQNLLRKVLSPKGDIKVDELSNILVLTDYQANVNKVKELLKKVDQPPQQVLIEAKIVDITSKDLQNLGVTWQLDSNPGKGIFGRNTLFPERIKGTGAFAGPSSSLSGGQLKLDTLVFKGVSVTATLDALVQDQKAHLLASPSIVVLNNREARIIIGEKVPYKERTQTTTGTTETTKYIDVGTTLRVTPSINADGYITVSIHPEVSSVTALLDAGPRITTREADTTVRVKEGETIVIGGLIKQEDNRTRSRVPILGYIPIIGLAFGNRSKDQTQTELAVFITPKILRSYEERMKESKKALSDEAYVNILSTSNLNVQMKLYEKARRLDADEGLEARGKDYWLRKNQALSIFESILTQFPDGPKAAESGFRAASIYYELGELYPAKELCSKIISSYPSTSYGTRAKDLYRKIDSILKKQAQKKLGELKGARVKEEGLSEIELARKKAEQEITRAREEARREAKEEVARIKEEGRQKAEEEAGRIKEEARLKAQEEERKKEEARQKAEAARKKVEKEAARIKEEARLKAQETRKKAESAGRMKEEIRRKAEEGIQKKGEVDTSIKQDMARRSKEELIRAREEARQKAEEARQKAAQERALNALLKQEDARRKAKEEVRIKEEARKIAKEQARIREEIRRKTQEEAVRVKEEARKKTQEEAVRVKEEARKKTQEEAVRIKEEARRKAEEATRKQEETRRKAAEEARIKEETRRKAQEETARAKEAARKKAEEEAARKKEEVRIKAEEAARKQEEARRKAAEEARVKEEARRKAEDAARTKEEARRIAKEQARIREEIRRKAREAERAKEEAREKTEEAAAAREELRKKSEEELRAYEEARKKADEAAAAEGRY